MAQKTELAPAANPAAGGPSFVTSKDGTRIAYETLGSGPPLILVNGALGYRSLSFSKRMAEGLAKHFTVVNYDRRGRGDSTDTPPFSMQREIEDIAALAAATGPTPYLLGLSSGAALALEAGAAGVRVKKVAAYEPPYVAGAKKNPPPADYEERLKALIAQGRRDDALKFFMKTVGVPGFFLVMMRIMPIWKQLRASAHTLPYDAAAMNGFRVPTQRLASIKVPTIVVGGEKSPESLRDAVDAVARAVPNAQKRMLPKQTHNVKPDVLAAALADFFGTGNAAPVTRAA